LLKGLNCEGEEKMTNKYKGFKGLVKMAFETINPNTKYAFGEKIPKRLPKSSIYLGIPALVPLYFSKKVK
jgi:hypothetical protein